MQRGPPVTVATDTFRTAAQADAPTIDGSPLAEPGSVRLPGRGLNWFSTGDGPMIRGAVDAGCEFVGQPGCGTRVRRPLPADWFGPVIRDSWALVPAREQVAGSLSRGRCFHPLHRCLVLLCPNGRRSLLRPIGPPLSGALHLAQISSILCLLAPEVTFVGRQL